MPNKFSNAISDEIFNRFRECVEASGLSYPKLEALSGIPKSNIQRYIQRKSKIPFECFVKLSLAIGQSPSVLLGWRDEEKISLTPHEEDVIKSYRAHPEMQAAIDTLLGLDEKKNVQVVKIAARSGIPVEERPLTDSEIELFTNGKEWHGDDEL